MMYYDVLDALAEGGCPICRLALRSVRRDLDALNYEFVNDPGMRAELRAARGFCNVHAWQFMDMPHAVFGAAIIYRDIIATLCDELPRARAGPPALRLVRPPIGHLVPGRGRSAPAAQVGRLHPERDCPACRPLAEVPSGYQRVLLAHLHDDELRGHYAASGGLCVPHLAGALIQVDGAEALHLLLEVAADRVAALRVMRPVAADDAAAFVEMMAGKEGATPAGVAAHRRHDAGMTAESAAAPTEPIPCPIGAGCPVCAMSLARVDAYLERLPDRVEHEPALVQQLREARGLCNLHGWRLLQLVPSAAVADVCQSALQVVAATLARGTRSDPDGAADSRGVLWLLQRLLERRAGRGMAVALAPQAPCPVCEFQTATEREATHNLLEASPRRNAGAGCCLPAALCLRHVALAIALTGGVPQRHAIISCEVRSWEHLLTELDEYIRKQDYRFRGEPWGAEQDAPRRSVALVAGAAGVRGTGSVIRD